ncbi:MAG: hypothetical protein KDD99_27690, partial [Bacteroidetes bacterium]|nr:hypothetical protein [Bacteroidota bacterium]
LRIGIHLGDIVQKEGHIFGDAVNIASRIESMGVAGAVLVSSNVRNQIKNKPEFELTSLGRFSFKNVEEEMSVYALANEGFVVPRKEEMQGKGQKVAEGDAKPRKQNMMIRAMSLGFLSVFVGISIWSVISWMNQTESQTRNISKSIAVLPFVDMSQAKNQEYLGDGMAEEVLNLLTQIPSLKVTSRSSSFSFKGQNTALPEIADKLGVSYILEGSVREYNEQLKISVQLVKVEGDQNVWTQTWDRHLNDAFAIQEEIAAEVVRALHTNLLHGLSPQAQEVDPETYRLYLQAQYLFNQRTLESISAGEKTINSALQIDSTYAPAWLLKGNIAEFYAQYGSSESTGQSYEELRQIPLDFARKAITYDPNNGQAHALIGSIYYNLYWEFDSADYYLEKALRLNPGSAEILWRIGLFKGTRNNLKAGIALLEKAKKLDPLSPSIYLWLSNCYMFDGNFEQAEKNARYMLLLNENAAEGKFVLASILIYQDRINEAEQLVSTIKDLRYQQLLIQSLIAYEKNEIQQSDYYIQEIIDGASEEAAYQIAEAYGYRGNLDEAFEWLSIAYRQNDPGIAFVLVDPSFTFLKKDPRWKAFLEDTGFE